MTGARASSETTVQKVLAILDLFGPEQPILSLDDIVATLGITRPTAYRYLRELCASGYLARLAAGFVLGPKIIALDRRIQDLDPLLASGRDLFARLASDLRCDVMLIAYFGGRMVVTHRERGPEPLTISFDRGRVAPLTRGAGSKILFAHLAPGEVAKLFTDNASAFAEAGQIGRAHV